MPNRLTWTQMQKAVQTALRVTQAAIDGLAAGVQPEPTPEEVVAAVGSTPANQWHEIRTSNEPVWDDVIGCWSQYQPPSAAADADDGHHCDAPGDPCDGCDYEARSRRVGPCDECKHGPMHTGIYPCQYTKREGFAALYGALPTEDTEQEIGAGLAAMRGDFADTERVDLLEELLRQSAERGECVVLDGRNGEAVVHWWPETANDEMPMDMAVNAPTFRAALDRAKEESGMSDMTRHCPLCGDFARRAEKAESDLAALRAETADLREIERCKRSIVEAGVHWEGGSEHRKHFRIYQGEPDKNGCYPWVWWGMDGSASDWQQAERAAWDLAAEPFRARCKAAGWPVLCITPRGNCGPITIEGPAYRIKCFGEPYGYPTLDALEQAAQWAEAHPANSPAVPDSAVPEVCPRCGKRCAHD